MKKNPYTAGTTKARLFDLLKSRRWQHVQAMVKAGGFRFGARIEEMRRDGLTIRAKRDAEQASLFHYRLVA